MKTMPEPVGWGHTGKWEISMLKILSVCHYIYFALCLMSGFINSKSSFSYSLSCSHLLYFLQNVKHFSWLVNEYLSQLEKQYFIQKSSLNWSNWTLTSTDSECKIIWTRSCIMNGGGILIPEFLPLFHNLRTVFALVKIAAENHYNGISHQLV